MQQSLKISAFYLCVFLSWIYGPDVMATHNRAGEITYKHIPTDGEPYRYEFTITTYTKKSGDSEPADRDTLDIDFGDGSQGKAPRINGDGEEIVPDIYANIYQTNHSYPGPFNYLVSMQDPNRIDQIINIGVDGNSVNVEFYIQDTIFFRDPQFFGVNSSPILLQPPIDFGNVGYTFIHNPNAHDEDGDSLYFELISPLRAVGDEVPFYQYPTEISPGPENNLTLNSATGELIWETPQQAGIYNIAILIREFRNGVEMGNLIRDMQIIVEDLQNRPPEITPVRDTCVVVGETLLIDITATDPDPMQSVTLTALGGPFIVPNPAIFPSVTGSGTVESTFAWTLDCEHIFSEKYTVVFKAEDNFYGGDPAGPRPLSDLETWQITVVPPPPEFLQAVIIDGEINLFWNLAPDEYQCLNSDKFRGFSVWRRVACDSSEIDRCQLGLEGTAYTKIANNITTNTFIDQTAVKGVMYTYRIVAEFADAFTGSTPPTPLNVSSSMASNPACIELPKDAPVITNVSIAATATANGVIDVCWSKPRAVPLDTTINMPPYRYEVYRAEGFGSTSFSLVHSVEAPSFYLANDTCFTDIDGTLNTLGFPYLYRIDFYANDILVDRSETASSVFLNILPADNQLELQWNFEVPWLNTEYHIFKQNEAGLYDSLTTTMNTTFVETDLINGEAYCYFVKAIGTYGSMDLIDPLINFSQEVCSSPIDTVPPCAPQLSATNICEQEEEITEEELINELFWALPSIDCTEDVVQYYIYYSSPSATNYELIDSTDRLNYEHLINGSLAGCYAVAAVDSFYNESDFSNIVCLENCLQYELPNVFTPNADVLNQNDKFVPRNAKFISSIDIKIYNRWGDLVYETTDPQINWDGTDQKSGEALSEGVYYYVCDVFEQTSEGLEIVNQQLNGYIHLIRGN